MSWESVSSLAFGCGSLEPIEIKNILSTEKFDLDCNTIRIDVFAFASFIGVDKSCMYADFKYCNRRLCIILSKQQQS